MKTKSLLTVFSLRLHSVLLEVHFVFDFSNEIVFVFKQYWKMIKYVLKTYNYVTVFCFIKKLSELMTRIR